MLWPFPLPVPRGPAEARRPRVPARAPRGDPHAHVWLASLLLQPTSPATRECAWADPRRGLGGAEREPGSAASLALATRRASAAAVTRTLLCV